MSSLTLPAPSAPNHGPCQPRQRRVTRDRFIKLLISRKKLQRWSDPAAGLVGLLDAAAGVVYVIERTELV